MQGSRRSDLNKCSETRRESIFEGVIDIISALAGREREDRPSSQYAVLCVEASPECKWLLDGDIQMPKAEGALNVVISCIDFEVCESIAENYPGLERYFTLKPDTNTVKVIVIDRGGVLIKHVTLSCIH